jgi:hypothetical protein
MTLQDASASDVPPTRPLPDQPPDPTVPPQPPGDPQPPPVLPRPDSVGKPAAGPSHGGQAFRGRES